MTESAVSGSVTDSHVYTTDGTYTVTLAVTDNNGGIGMTTTQVVVSPPPAASAGGPYTGVEATPVTLTGTASNYVSLALDLLDRVRPGRGDVHVDQHLDADARRSPANDNGVVTVTLKATNNVNVVATSTATVTINNAAPVVAAPLINPSSVGRRCSGVGERDVHRCRDERHAHGHDHLGRRDHDRGHCHRVRWIGFGRGLARLRDIRGLHGDRHGDRQGRRCRHEHRGGDGELAAHGVGGRSLQRRSKAPRSCCTGRSRTRVVVRSVSAGRSRRSVRSGSVCSITERGHADTVGHV